jgi:hypothetical protein
MKTKRERYLSREAAEKQVRKYIEAVRKIRGFVNVEVKATVRIADARDPNAAITVAAKYN